MTTATIVLSTVVTTLLAPSSASTAAQSHQAPSRVTAEARHLTAAVNVRDRAQARRYATKHVVRSLFADRHMFSFGGCFRSGQQSPAGVAGYPWSCDLSPRGHSNLYEPFVSFRRQSNGQWIAGYITWSDAQ